MRDLLLAVALGTLAASAVGACTPGSKARKPRPDSTEVAARKARVEQAVARGSPAGAAAPVARWVLPGALAEVSGLALTPDGRLFAHNDELARIVEVDYRGGTVGKSFLVGANPLRGDFEGLTAVGESLFLLESNGTLYEFREGANGTRVGYKTHDTRLGKECEFEGLAFEPASNSLLLACKIVGTKELANSLVIYRWKVDGGARQQATHLAVPLAQVVGSRKWKGYHPSDITVDPSTGNYVLVSAQEEALVELTPAGQVVSVRPLPRGHQHTEGVAITRDGILIISDEAGRGSAAITLYKR